MKSLTLKFSFEMKELLLKIIKVRNNSYNFLTSKFAKILSNVIDCESFYNLLF